jgi:hypothetical protein
VLVVGLVR